MENSLIASKLTAARKDLRKAQKMAAELRDEYLEEMAQLQINSRNMNLATITKNIHHREEVKTSFSMLRPTSKRKQGGAVSYIKDPIPLKSTASYNETLMQLGFQHNYKIIYDGDKSFCTFYTYNALYFFLSQLCGDIPSLLLAPRISAHKEQRFLQWEYF
eukprot:8288848-Ditylum_brightwellii.AAC.1